jgi:signal peptidase II
MKLILRNGSIFLGIWIIVMIVFTVSHAISNGLPDFEYLWKFTVLPGLVLASIAIIATILQINFKVKKGINWIFLIAAIAIDQIIKTYLFSLEWETLSIPLIEPVFYLQPTQNTLGSYLWVLLNFKNGSHLFNIILFLIVGFLFVEIWRFYTSRKRNSFWINGFIHLFLAGLFANIIDNAYWGGSLDYITIRPFYTFDLKDMYITLCEFFLLTELIDNKLFKKLIKMPKDDSNRLTKDFTNFILGDIKKIIKAVVRKK